MAPVSISKLVIRLVPFEKEWRVSIKFGRASSYPVSYTHLDVYKRQSIENESSEKYSLVITDIAGAIVSEISFFGNKTEIHKGNLAAGIYQYSISAKSTVVSRGKFVIN